MAKKRRGRPKKSQVTYDSKETKFILALVFFALGVFAFLSYLITDDNNLFEFIRSLFGSVTFGAGIFFINVSLALFGADWFSTTKRSLLSQFLIVVLLSVLIAANADPLLLKQNSYNGDFGGIIGYQLAIFSGNYLLLNLTTPVALLAIIFLLPSAFNQSIAEFFGNVFEQVKMLLDLFTSQIEEEDSGKVEKPELDEVEPSSGPSMFSHFRKPSEMTKSEIVKSDVGAKPILANNLDRNLDDNAKTKSPDFVGISGSRPEPRPIASKFDGGMGAEGGSEAVPNDTGTLLTQSLKFPKWQLPPTDLLDPLPKIEVPKEDVKNNSTIIEQTLASFGIESKVMATMVGPSVTQYALDIALGIKVSKISNLRNDLALALATSANSVRIEVPIPGTSYVGIEIPNMKRRPVFFRELIEDDEMASPKYKLPVSVGKGIAGNAVVGDIQGMPHLLIAGATGSGKSVLTVSFILSLLMKRSPDEVRFIMVDPKQVELSDFNGIPHLLTPVIVDMDKVLNALKWAVAEMENRYTLFREASVRNLEGFNQKMGFAALPYIVIVIDELADMMLTAGKVEIETNIVRLAQKARATGIHLILATQRPSVNVITGIIKANIPGRIGMSVTTGVDSRVIIDTIGAESLLGKGDMLFKEPDKNKPSRVQGVFVKQEEVQRVVGFIKDQAADDVEYIDDIVADKSTESVEDAGSANISGDDLFSDAVRVIVSTQKGSASMLQRKLSLGYNRAAKLIDEMEELGVVGPANGSKPREVLITDAEGFLSQINK